MDVQPDLFGGASIIGASRSVQQQEGAQCVGQTDVFALLSCDDCNSTGAVPASGHEDDAIDGYVPCPTCGQGWAL